VASPPTAASADPLTELNHAWDGFFGAIRRAKGRASRQHGSELTLPQVHLLEPLAGGASARIGELAEAAGVAAPTASRMIDSLEREGIVARRRADGDRRATAVELTPTGGELYASKRADMQSKRNEIFGSLSATEREQAAHLLRRMAELIDEL
jgi:MarR family transcriptional regulator, organic hydroperoxide resistance regulator